MVHRLDKQLQWYIWQQIYDAGLDTSTMVHMATDCQVYTTASVTHTLPLLPCHPHTIILCPDDHRNESRTQIDLGSVKHGKQSMTSTHHTHETLVVFQTQTGHISNLKVPSMDGVY